MPAHQQVFVAWGNAWKIGCIKIQKMGQFGDVDLHDGNQRIQIHRNFLIIGWVSDQCWGDYCCGIFLGQHGVSFFHGMRHNSVYQFAYLFATMFRHTLASSVPANQSREKTGCRGKFFRRTSKLCYVFVQLFTEGHGMHTHLIINLLYYNIFQKNAISKLSLTIKEICLFCYHLSVQ